MRVVVTGAAGMLAAALVPELRGRGHDVIPATRAECDVTDGASVARFLERARPEVVVQCAAYTNVDGAERERDLAFAVNAEGTAKVAEVCHRIDAWLVYPSTDYVFGDGVRRPRRPEDPTEPLNVYGASKLEGERAALRLERTLVVRTSWLYGAGGGNFVDTILGLARSRDRLEIVDDQVGRPTWTRSLSRTLVELVEGEASGIFHASDAGPEVSWFAFAAHLLHIEGISVDLAPISSERFGRPARRPGRSVLELEATERRLGHTLPDWRDSVGAYLAERERGSAHQATRAETEGTSRQQGGGR